MPDYIPFPNDNTGPSKTIPAGTGNGFYVGQEIYVRTTGSNPAADNSPLVKSSATVQIINAVPSTSIGNVTISGEASPETGTEYSFTAVADGDAGNLTYAWSTSPATSTIDHAAPSQNSAGIQFDSDNTYDVICTITSGDSNPTDSPKTTTVQRTSSTPTPPSDYANYTAFKAAGANGLTMTDAGSNPERIGTFRPYPGGNNAGSSYTVGEFWVNAATSTNLRLGPFATWTDDDGTSYTPITSSSSSVQDWIDDFIVNNQLDVTVTKNGVSELKEDCNLRAQSGYLQLQTNDLPSNWDGASDMTILVVLRKRP